MENASKALIMAAGVLMGVVILTLAVYLYATFSSQVEETEQIISDNQLNQFNSQFTSYEGKDDITVYDILTVTNLAINYNKTNEFKITDTNYYIGIYKDNKIINKDDYSSPDLLGNLDNEMKSENGKLVLKKYSCTVFLNENTGRVIKVTFLSV